MGNNEIDSASLVTKKEETDGDNTRSIYQCKYRGTSLCHYICLECKVMNLILEKLSFFEDIEKQL